MNYTVTRDTFEHIGAYINDTKHCLGRPCLFVLPGWLEAWRRTFGSGAELFLRTVKQDGRLIGVAPLMLKDKTASFIGSPDVCDYLDFIVVPGMEVPFFEALLDYLAGRGVEQLDLHSLREDSASLGGMARAVLNRGIEMHCSREDLSMELDLPASWERYLAELDKKQRHEVRRKLRRLQEAGEPRYFTVWEPASVREYRPLFFRMFAASRKDKADFMDGAREEFFRSIIDYTAARGLAEFGVLELDGRPAAMVLYFDYNGCFYLYNSGYDPRYGSVSAGLLCKILCIKDAIGRGRKKFDFLKGGEEYKHRLGGREISIFNCRITTNTRPGKDQQNKGSAALINLTDD